MSSIKIRPLTILLVLLAIVFAILGFLYFTKTAANLPSFLPGHVAHSAHKHVKHGMVAITLAVAALIGAWITTAPDRGRAS